MANLDFVNNVADNVVSRQMAPPPGPQGGMPPGAPHPEGIPPEMILQALQTVQPPLAPEQMQAVAKIVILLTQKEDAQEPPEPGEMAPPPMM